MSKAVFLGLTTVDIVNYVERYPSSNEKIRANRQLVYAGGPAANAAVAYAAFGNSISLITGLGSQPLADLARDDLQTHSVELIDMASDVRMLPVLSSITVDERTGDRSVVYTNTAGRKLTGEGYSKEILADASLVMLDGYYLPQAVELAEMAKEIGIPIVLDGGSWKDGIDRVLSLVDYAICSENFLPAGCHGTRDVAYFLRDAGVGSISISRGGSSLYGLVDGTEFEIPVKAVEVRDTLGAGDILHGTFCHFIKKYNFFDSLHLAADVASESCRYRGTREWIEYCGSGV